MKKLFLLFSLPFFLFSCNKNSAYETRVGFYFEEQGVQGDQHYDLYIDDVYAGQIPVMSAAPQDSTLLLFKVLNDKRHDIDVKHDNQLLSATCLEIKKNKVYSGTNRQKALQVSGVNGSKYFSGTGGKYALYVPFK